MEPVIVNDYAAWEQATEVARTGGLRGALAVPLARTGAPLGALVVRSYDDEARFSEEDAKLLALFGDQVVAALTAADAFEQQRRAMEELERLNRAKSDFVSIVSHEFRTPLTGIQGFSEMMRDEPLTVDEMKEYAGDINKDAQRLNRMINEMLDLVRDRGMGIPGDALESIFERYGRIESRATRYIQGTGLGLPIVRQIMTMHGGQVWAESTVGEGSLFHVTLPLAEVLAVTPGGMGGHRPPNA